MGKAILESYSRVLKQLAMNIIARIDDLIYIDDATKRRNPSEAQDPVRLRQLSKECYSVWYILELLQMC